MFKPLPQDDPVQRCPDITLARRILDWQPTVTLDDGLSRTIGYFERMLTDRARADGVAGVTGPAVAHAASP